MSLVRGGAALCEMVYSRLCMIVRLCLRCLRFIQTTPSASRLNGIADRRFCLLFRVMVYCWTCFMQFIAHSATKTPWFVRNASPIGNSPEASQVSLFRAADIKEISNMSLVLARGGVEEVMAGRPPPDGMALTSQYLTLSFRLTIEYSPVRYTRCFRM